MLVDVVGDRGSVGVNEEELYEFILECIDTVPHLEALLLLWNCRPRALTGSEMAERLYVDVSGSRSIMSDLERRGLVTAGEDEPHHYLYSASPQNDRFVSALARAYQTDLIRISTAIHSKASSSVREFARAFQFQRKRKKP